MHDWRCVWIDKRNPSSAGAFVGAPDREYFLDRLIVNFDVGARDVYVIASYAWRFSQQVL